MNEEELTTGIILVAFIALVFSALGMTPADAAPALQEDPTLPYRQGSSLSVDDTPSP